MSLKGVYFQTVKHAMKHSSEVEVGYTTRWLVGLNSLRCRHWLVTEKLEFASSVRRRPITRGGVCVNGIEATPPSSLLYARSNVVKKPWSVPKGGTVPLSTDVARNSIPFRILDSFAQFVT